MMKCAMERPECRKMCTVCRDKRRNRRENLPGFRETMGKHANVSVLVGGWR